MTNLTTCALRNSKWMRRGIVREFQEKNWSCQHYCHCSSLHHMLATQLQQPWKLDEVLERTAERRMPLFNAHLFIE